MSATTRNRLVGRGLSSAAQIVLRSRGYFDGYGIKGRRLTSGIQASAVNDVARRLGLGAGGTPDERREILGYLTATRLDYVQRAGLVNSTKQPILQGRSDQRGNVWHYEVRVPILDASGNVLSYSTIDVASRAPIAEGEALRRAVEEARNQPQPITGSGPGRGRRPSTAPPDASIIATYVVTPDGKTPV